MNKSESIKEIAAALAKAQEQITNAGKNSQNPHFRSSYADLAEVLNTVRPVFAAHGMSVVQAPEYGDGIVTVETMITHSSGEWISSSVSAPVGKQDAQGVGSAITYCRRYGLAAMAGIAQEDDDGNAAVQGPGRKAAVKPAAVNNETTLIQQAKLKHKASIDAIKNGLADGDLAAAAEAWFELTEDEQRSIWAAPSKGGPFTTEERLALKSSELRVAYYGDDQAPQSAPTNVANGMFGAN